MNIGSAQQPTVVGSNADKRDYLSWSAKVNSGVISILTGRRGNAISTASKNDICQCLTLLTCIDELPFDWSIYTNPPELRPPLCLQKKWVAYLMKTKYAEPEDDDDEEVDDVIERPSWNTGEIHIVK